MAEITAEMVKSLREATNVSMMECKKALVESEGDIEKAMRLLRERGMAVAAKRAAKEANQGVIASEVRDGGKAASLVEVNCETDFVARNEAFRAFVSQVARRAVESEASLAEAMQDELMAQIAAIGENLKIRRHVRFVAEGTGKIGSYIHLGGKVGVLVDVACGRGETVGKPAFEELVRDLTLQVAAANPAYVAPAEVPADVIASEREIYAKQVTGKPANIVEKIVDGKMKKYYEEVCLLNQPFVKEPKQSITQLVEAKGKELGDAITVRRFVRFQLGA